MLPDSHKDEFHHSWRHCISDHFSDFRLASYEDMIHRKGLERRKLSVGQLAPAVRMGNGAAADNAVDDARAIPWLKVSTHGTPDVVIGCIAWYSREDAVH